MPILPSSLSSLPVSKYQSPFPEPTLPFSSLPLEINAKIWQEKLKFVFKSTEQVISFFEDATKYGGRSLEQIEKALALLQEPFDQYSADEFGQALVDAEILPAELKHKVDSEFYQWLKAPPNLLATLRWIPAEGMESLCEYPFAPKILWDSLRDAKAGKSAELALAMVKDKTGVDLGIRSDCDYLQLTAEFGKARPSERKAGQTSNSWERNLDPGIEIAAALLDKGVDINAVDTHGQTALHLASGDGYNKMVELLINRGADINARNENGQTPLWYGAAGNHIEVVKRLLDAKADSNLFISSRSAPLNAAIWHKYDEVAELLRAAGALTFEESRTDEGKELLNRQAFLGEMTSLDLDEENEGTNEVITAQRVDAGILYNLFTAIQLPFQWAMGLIQRIYHFLTAALHRRFAINLPENLPEFIRH